MKALTEPSITTYHYEYDQNGNRTLVEIKDDNLTMESTTYEYDRLNKMISSREVTADGLYIYEYKYDDNGNLIQEDRHRAYELNTNQYQNIRRYEYTKDNKLEAVYSGNTLLVAYTYDGDGTITSTLDRDLDFNQNLNINDHGYINRLTANQRQLINKINPSDTILYELTEYVLERNQEYSQVLMQRDGAGFLSTTYTYGNQRINTESINNLSGIYTYDGRGSVSSVIGGWGDFRATYWYDGLGNVKSQIHGYGAFGSGKRYFGYNAEQYNPVTGNQNLRNRQVNIRRQRFLTEDTYLGNQTDTLSINRYIYGSDNPLKYKDPSGFMSSGSMSYASSSRSSNGCGGGSSGLISTGIIYSSNMLYGPGGFLTNNIQQIFKGTIIYGFNNTEIQNTIDPNDIFESFRTINNRIDAMINWAIIQSNFPDVFWERNYDNSNRVDNDVIYNDWYYGNTTSHHPWCSVFVIYNGIASELNDVDILGNSTEIMPSYETAFNNHLQGVGNLKNWYTKVGRYHATSEVQSNTYIPQKGDVFFMKDSKNSHTGLVVSYDSVSKTITTIEGNTDPDGGNNGYAVMSRQRPLSSITGFGYNLYTGDMIQ